MHCNNLSSPGAVRARQWRQRGVQGAPGALVVYVAMCGNEQTIAGRDASIIFRSRDRAVVRSIAL